MLHQRECHGLVRQGDDWSTALAVVPTHVELVNLHAPNDILRRHYSFVGVTFQEELASAIISLVVEVDSSDFGSRES